MLEQVRKILLFLFIFFSILFIWGCSPEITERSCQSANDCLAGELCLRKICTMPNTTNDAPIAQIKRLPRMRQNKIILLDGSKSKDSDGKIIEYRWKLSTKPTESKAILKDIKTTHPSFFADKSGKFIVELIVIDNEKKASRPDQITIIIYGAEANGEPVANAGKDQIVGDGATVQLDGSHSTDPEQDKLTYQWKLKSKPKDSTAKISNEQASKPTFITDKLGKYIFSLVVNDGLEKSFPDTVSIEAIRGIHLIPKLTKMTPNKGFSESIIKVQLIGSSFSPDAFVLFRRVRLSEKSAKVKNSTSIEVMLDLSGIPEGKHEIVVRNPNNKQSNPMLFNVQGLPTPSLSKINPNKISTGTKLTINITGTGFIKSTEILFQTTPLRTTYKTATEIDAEIDLTSTPQGEYEIMARNKGGRSSNILKFYVLPPSPPPVLRVLNPPSATVGTKIDFSVHGSGFSKKAVIYFDGKAIPSLRVRRDEIKAIPKLDLSHYAAGDYKVKVRNINGTFSKETEIFTVKELDPTPHIDRILPFSIFLQDLNTIAIYGKNFTKNSKIYIDKTLLDASTVNIRSDTYIEVLLNTNKGKWTAGEHYAQVVSATGKKSNTFKLTFSHRTPTVSSIDPASWTTKCDTDINIYGTNFLPQSTIHFDNTIFSQTNSTHKLNFISHKQLSFHLNAKKLIAKNYTLYVDNGYNAISGKYTYRLQSSTSIPIPEIQSLSPSSGSADTEVVVTLNGSYSKPFWIGAQVFLDGKKQKTTCPRPSSLGRCYGLEATLDLSGMKTGTYNLIVSNPCHTNSSPIPFKVTDPLNPYISNVSPSYAFIGDKKQITIKGLHFSKKHQLIWDGQVIPTTYKTEKEIITTKDIDFSKLTAPKIDNFYIDNKNGLKTATLQFSILKKNHHPLIKSLSKTSFERGKIHSNITVTGEGFTKKTTFYFQNKLLNAIFYTPYQMVITQLDFTTIKTGTYSIYAEDNKIKSNIVNVLAEPIPIPLIDRITTFNEYAGQTVRIYIYGSQLCRASGFTCMTTPDIIILDKNLTHYGQNFKITRTMASNKPGGSYIYGELDASKMKKGKYQLFLKYKTGEKSSSFSFLLTQAPMPYIASISPGFIYENSNIYMTISGNYFAANAKVVINKKSYLPNFLSTRTIRIALPGFLKGQYDLSIKNPDGTETPPYTLTVVDSKATKPIITRLSWSPSEAPRAGKVYYSLTIYGIHWDKSATIDFLLNGKQYVPVKPTYCHRSSVSFLESYCRLAAFDTSLMKAGKQTLQYTDSAKKKSDIFSFILQRPPPPYISSISPSSIKITPKIRFDIKGREFTQGAIARIGLQLIPTSFDSATKLYFNLQTQYMKKGTHQLIIQNPDGQNSNSIAFELK